MKLVEHNGGIMHYQDDEGNELRVWDGDSHGERRLLGADYNGVEYGNCQLYPKEEFKWKRIGRGRIPKDFFDWLENAKQQIKG